MEKNETIAQSDTGQALPPIGYIGSIKIEIGILLSCPIKNRLYFQSPNDILFLGFKNRVVRNFRTGIS